VLTGVLGELLIRQQHAVGRLADQRHATLDLESPELGRPSNDVVAGHNVGEAICERRGILAQEFPELSLATLRHLAPLLSGDVGEDRRARMTI
jgi:hypothetical protein